MVPACQFFFMIKTVSFVVKGRVQGVGFRYTTRRAAEHFGLTGWVRNCANGDVEGVAQGESGSVDQFEKWLWQGPDHARVISVDTSTLQPVQGQGFSIRR